MAEKNASHGHFQPPPNAPPPPYSIDMNSSPGNPNIGIVVPNMGPGQAIPVQTTIHQQQNAQSPPVMIYANVATQFGPYPQRYTCPHCRAHVMTETRTKPGLLTYILSGTLLVLAWYLLCCLVPCCIRECQDIQHICPNCKSKLGLYKRI